MKITLIAAMDSMGGIGKNGAMPWYCNEDLKHFKAYTDGKVCVMGRNTWDSLPVKPLPNRENWVLASKDTPNLFGRGVSLMALSASSIIGAALDEQIDELCITQLQADKLKLQELQELLKSGNVDPQQCKGMIKMLDYKIRKLKEVK